MAYKMRKPNPKGSPAKQLKPEYMRNPKEKELFSSPEGQHYETIPSGEIRSPGDHVRYTGPDVVEEGMFGPRVTKRSGDIEGTGMGGWPKADEDIRSEEVGPVEDVEAMYDELDELELARREKGLSRYSKEGKEAYEPEKELRERIDASERYEKK